MDGNTEQVPEQASRLLKRSSQAGRAQRQGRLVELVRQASRRLRRTDSPRAV